MSRKPLLIELFCGCFGWSAGWLSLGGRAIGFDIEHLPHHGPVPDGAELVLQDVMTLHGSQFRDADLILCSPPCQAYSYRAMPWKRAKALPPPDNSLFDACFRIQWEASKAAGRYIPMVVENVKGAQPWVGRARWNYGSFYLWGDVPALMPFSLGRKGIGGGHGPAPAGTGATSWFFGSRADPRDIRRNEDGEWSRLGLKDDGIKNGSGSRDEKYSFTIPSPRLTCDESAGTKQGGNWWHDPASMTRRHSSRSSARKAASAQIARIPYPLSFHIAQCYWPDGVPQQGDTRLQTCGEA